MASSMISAMIMGDAITRLYTVHAGKELSLGQGEFRSRIRSNLVQTSSNQFKPSVGDTYAKRLCPGGRPVRPFYFCFHIKLHVLREPCSELRGEPLGEAFPLNPHSKSRREPCSSHVHIVQLNASQHLNTSFGQISACEEVRPSVA